MDLPDDMNPWADADSYTQGPVDPWNQAQAHNTHVSRNVNDDWDDFISGGPAETKPAKAETQPSPVPESKPTMNLDPWGGFESFESSVASKPVPSAGVFQTPRETSFEPVEESQPVYFPRPSQTLKANSPTPVPKLKQPPRTRSRPPRDENVLFDAEDLTEEEDEYDEAAGDYDEDFGDFENAPSSTPASQVQRKTESTTKSQDSVQMSLIDFDDANSMSAVKPSVAMNTMEISKRQISPYDPFGDLEAAFGSAKLSVSSAQSGITPQLTSVNVAPPKPVQKTTVITNIKNNGIQTNRVPGDLLSDETSGPFNEESFESLERGKNEDFVKPSPSNRFKKGSSEEWTNFETASTPNQNSWDDWDESKQQTPEKDIRVESSNGAQVFKLPVLLQAALAPSAVAPANVPPPAILLTLFPPIFTIVKTETLDHFTEGSGISEARETMLATQNGGEFLSEYLSIATVLGRIIAGRKLRWKRDTILAQSMRIGPASSGRAGGMKLTSLDKNENTREEREVSNALRQWRLQLGKLRATIAAVGVLSPIPELADMLPVRMAQLNEGAVNATKACALCGLKRNERVQKIDFDVQDSFGEWWVDHWGHRACKDFWNTYEKELRSK